MFDWRRPIQFKDFFSPIHCTYTSLPQDGMARNYFSSRWIRKSTKFILSGSILFLPPYTGGEDERLVWAGIEPRSSCFTFTSNSSYHWTMALRTLNLVINRTKFIPVAYYEQGRKNTFILCQAPSGLVVNFTTSAHQLDWKVQLEISLTNWGPST